MGIPVLIHPDFRPHFGAGHFTIHLWIHRSSSGRAGGNPIKCALSLTPGFVQTAEGSILVSFGNTRVLTNDKLSKVFRDGCATWPRVGYS